MRFSIKIVEHCWLSFLSDAITTRELKTKQDVEKRMKTSESKFYWFKVAAGLIVPGYEWRALWLSFIDFVCDAFTCILLTSFRVMILVTFPISVPLLTIWFIIENKKAVETYNRKTLEILASMHSITHEK